MVNALNIIIINTILNIAIISLNVIIPRISLRKLLWMEKKKKKKEVNDILTFLRRRKFDNAILSNLREREK